MANLNIPIPDSIQDELKTMIRNAAIQAINEATQRETKAKDWMNQKQACEYIGVSFATFQNYRKLGLRVSVIQGKTLVSRKELNRFLELYEQ